ASRVDRERLRRNQSGPGVRVAAGRRSPESFVSQPDRQGPQSRVREVLSKGLMAMTSLRFVRLCMSLALLTGLSAAASRQTPDADSRREVIETAQADRAQTLSPYVPSGGERVVTRIESMFVYPITTWHPFLESAEHGGGFTLGAGYLKH